MPKKIEYPIIECVGYTYVGCNKDFNEFLKAVIREYIVDDKMAPDCNKTSDDFAIKAS
jgi:hypothetical protein